MGIYRFMILSTRFRVW